MIGDAVPIRFSRRIPRKASTSPTKITQKKIRRSPVKKRTSDANATKNAEIGREDKLEKNSKQTSKFLKQACHKLKPLIRKRSRKNIPQTYRQKRKIRSSLDISQSNLTTNKRCSPNLSNELQHESKKVTKKENRKRSADNKKQPCRKSPRLSKGSQNLPHSLFDENEKVVEKKNCKNSSIGKENLYRRGTRVSRSSLSPKGNIRQKELIDSYIKSSKERKPNQNKNSVHVADVSSISVLTPNSGKPTHTSKHSEIKTPARVSMKAPNQEISLLTPAYKSFFITPVHKGACASKHSENRKSARLSKEMNRSIVMNSEVSLCTPAFQSILESSQPEKQLEKRKSSRSLGSSPLRTLNKELPLSTPISLLRKSPDTSLKKSFKPNKNTKLLPLQTDNSKQRRSKLSNNDNCTSNAIIKRKQKQHVNQHEKSSDKFKKPMSNETENFPFDVLTTLTPVSVLDSVCKRGISKKGFSKSEPSKSKSSKIKLNALTSEKHVAKKGKKFADLPKIPGKGTLKRKRWMLQNLTEKNEGYEDDIFENQSFNQYKSAFHFGDESDGSSVNIATPKFDCILTPALPKKTPRFKDCMSPTEFLQARKTAEEYQYRRNKKRKSGDKPSSSGKKASMKKKNTAADIPEKKKLDFEEAVNKLIAIQKDLEKEAAVDDEEEDSYFSDVSDI